MTETNREFKMSACPATRTHVVYRSRQFDQMLAWYRIVFGATVQHQNPPWRF